MISVSLIDDNPKIVEFFREVTLEMSDVVCLKTAASVEEYLSTSLPARKKHFLFLDVHLQRGVSINHIPMILEDNPDLEVIMYSVDEQYHHLITAFKLGASGYIVKQYDKESLKDFFYILTKGGAAISPQMAKKLINSIHVSTPANDLKNKLSQKELEILTYLAEGWTYQFIAENMDMSVDGVRYYIKKIYKTLKVNSRGEAVKVFQNTF